MCVSGFSFAREIHLTIFCPTTSYWLPWQCLRCRCRGNGPLHDVIDSFVVCYSDDEDEDSMDIAGVNLKVMLYLVMIGRPPSIKGYF